MKDRSESPGWIMESLRERVERSGGSLGGREWSKLEVLVSLWVRYGRAMNLTGSLDRLCEQVWEGMRAVSAASLRGGSLTGKRWIDVGSGGGFPGLVVVALDHCEVCLVEPRKKRSAFLEMALGFLKTRGSRVVRGRVDVTRPSQFLEQIGETPFDVASARAVWAPEVWVRVGQELVREDGVVVVHGTSEEGRVENGMSRVVFTDKCST